MPTNEQVSRGRRLRFFHRPLRTKIAVLATTLLITSARSTHGQEKCSDPSLDNLKHPPGTATAPLGTLGCVDKVGTGSIPMVLIPGAAFGGGIWKEFMQRNRDAYTMYAITPPGYEGTEPPPWPDNNDFTQRVWSDALCNAIIKLIDDESLDRPIVVGHHMLGDYYALRIALENPSKVRAVVVVSGTPSMAFPAWGVNKPGETVKTADLEQRGDAVKRFWVPFYRTVTEKMWKAGSFQGRTFCRDRNRATELYDTQVAVPIPTQVRYFLEYQTADLEPQLVKLAVPLLVLVPKGEWTLERAMDNMRESNEMMYGDREKAKSAWASNLTMMWGDVNEGIRWMFDQGFRWERLKSVVGTLTIRYIEDTGVFIMEDQPQAMDQELRTFTAARR